jgi:hypothetical protein
MLIIGNIFIIIPMMPITSFLKVSKSYLLIITKYQLKLIKYNKIISKKISKIKIHHKKEVGILLKIKSTQISKKKEFQKFKTQKKK